MTVYATDTVDPGMAQILAALDTRTLTAAEYARLKELKNQWNAYYGNHPRSLRTRVNGPDDNVIINFAKAMVDKSVSFLFGNEIDFEIDETTDTPEEQYLRKFWAFNKGMILLQKVALNGSVNGHAFIKLLPADITLNRPYPKLINLDPASVTVIWDHEDLDHILKYRIQYNAVNPKNDHTVIKRQILTEADDRQTWLIQDFESDTAIQGGRFRLVGSVDWIHPWPPIFHCQNLPAPNEFWGMSDLEPDIRKHNYAINFIASNTQRIIRNHAHPKVWARGVAAKEPIDFSPDMISVIPSESGLIDSIEMRSDLSGSLAYLRWLVEHLLSVTRVPEIALGKADTPGNLSGPALRIKFQSLVEKTETKRLLYGAMLIDICRRVLELDKEGGGASTVPITTTTDPTMDPAAPETTSPTDDLEQLVISIVWPELIAGDPIQERQAAQIDHDLGVSAFTLLKKFGYDPIVEEKRRQKEQAEAVQNAQDMFSATGGGVDPNGGPTGNSQPDNRVPGKPGRPTAEQSKRRPLEPGRANNNRGNAG